MVVEKLWKKYKMCGKLLNASGSYVNASGSCVNASGSCELSERTIRRAVCQPPPPQKYSETHTNLDET